jgi:hypothetical protein
MTPSGGTKEVRATEGACCPFCVVAINVKIPYYRKTLYSRKEKLA